MHLSGIHKFVDSEFWYRIPEVARFLYPRKKVIFGQGRDFSLEEAQRIAEFIHRVYRDKNYEGDYVPIKKRGRLNPVVLPGNIKPVKIKRTGPVAEYNQQLVYFILAGEFNRVKIGISNRPMQRLAMIQTGCPTKLSMLLLTTGGIDEERRLHAKYQQYHVINEWFEYSDEIREYVESLKV